MNPELKAKKLIAKIEGAYFDEGSSTDDFHDVSIQAPVGHRWASGTDHVFVMRGPNHHKEETWREILQIVERGVVLCDTPECLECRDEKWDASHE